MTRDEMLDALRVAMVTESACAIAIQNMIGTFTWSGLPDSVRRQVMENLDSLAAGPQQRSQRLKDLIARS